MSSSTFLLDSFFSLCYLGFKKTKRRIAMLHELFSVLKTQSQDVSAQYISKVERLFKIANISNFRDTVLLATLALIQKEYQMNIDATQKFLEKKLEDPYVAQAFDNALPTYHTIALELEALSDLQLLTYILFSEVDSKKGSAFSSGSSINKLLAMLVKDEHAVADWSYGYGQFLLFSALYGNTKQLSGIDIESDCHIVTRVRLFLIPNGPQLHLLYGNIFNDPDLYRLNRPGSSIKLDAPTIVMHPPFGAAADMIPEDPPRLLSRVWRKFRHVITPAIYKSEWPFILTALGALAPGKKIFAITTNGAASTETYSEVRKELINQGLVNCVVQLSENLLQGTSIASTLWIFSKGNETVRLIDAGNIRTEGRRKFTLSDENIEEIIGLISNENNSLTLTDMTSSNKSDVPNESVRAHMDIVKNLSLLEIDKSNYNLSPSRHVGADFPSEYVLLKDVCQINRGILLKAQELDELVADNNSIKYITPKHLDNGLIKLSKVTSLAETDEILKRKPIDDDSIVISKLQPFKTGYVRQTKKNQVFSNGNTYHLKINKKAINSLFLLMYLNSDMAQKQLEQLSRGSSTSTLSISDLKDLKIPIIKRSVQDKLADEYRSLLKEEQRLQASLEKLAKTKNRLIEEVLD